MDYALAAKDSKGLVEFWMFGVRYARTSNTACRTSPR